MNPKQIQKFTFLTPPFTADVATSPDTLEFREEKDGGAMVWLCA